MDRVRMTSQEYAQELKAIVLYREENAGAVEKIARELGLKSRTVYDYLDGVIKVSVDFIRACAKVTADPDVIKMLEPEGWKLFPIQRRENTGDLEHEIGDVFIKAGMLHHEIRAALADKKITPIEQRRLLQTIMDLRREVSDLENILI